MPKPPRTLHPLTHQQSPQILRRNIRFHFPRHMLITSLLPAHLRHRCLHNAWMQYKDGDILFFQINRHVLEQAVQRGLGRAVRVRAAGGVVADGAHARRDGGDARVWRECEPGEERLC